MAVHPQEQLQQFQIAAALAVVGTGCGGGTDKAATLIQQKMSALAGISDPVSELTCNLPGSRKRGREEQPVLPTSNGAVTLYRQQQHQHQEVLQKQQLLLNLIHRKATRTAADLPIESSRFIQSAMTSTSGRPALLPSASPADPSTASPVCNNKGNNVSGGISSPGLISMLHYHSVEVDALVRLHTEKLRSGLQEATKRQCRAVASAMEQQVQRLVAEKQAELDAATKRNAELEERLRRAAAESHAWFTVARNSEALIAGLRAGLEQAVLQNLNRKGSAGADLTGALAEEEGYGDSEEEAGNATAVSCSVRCVEASSSVIGAGRNDSTMVGGCRFPCKSCGKPDACVLLLPCRHLCLCPSCESSFEECPICGGRKKSSMQINPA